MENPNPQVRVFIPWFGPWPFWMPAFLQSCRLNKGVAWQLFGDHPLAGLPPNVAFEQTTFADYCARVSQRLGIRFEPRNPYKLCDLKPALAAVHRDQLGDCRFWAFSDLDLVYGDLLDSFGAAMERWQVISTHATRISGHFCLLRNNDLCIEAFRQVPEWRQQLENPDHSFFDESAFSRRLLPHKRWPGWLRTVVYSGDRLVGISRFHEEYTTPRAGGRHRWEPGQGRLPGAWYWRDGRVTSDLTGDRTFPYFHFLDWKKTAWRDRDAARLWRLDAGDLARGYTVSAQGFAPLPAG